MKKRPTRGQWRGYAALCCLLLVALLLVIVLPKRQAEKPAVDHSPLQMALERYGDSLVAQSQSERQRYRARWKKPNHTEARQRQAVESHRHPYPERREPKRVVVELNSADTLDLQQLYGIGPAFARRIVNYRQRLGGYVSKEQLLEVYGMDEERYNGFVGQLTLDSSIVNKIDINNVSVNDLKRHPYIDYYQAKSIVQFRDQHGPYHSYSDLLLVNLVDEELVTKIEGYVQFN